MKKILFSCIFVLIVLGCGKEEPPKKETPTSKVAFAVSGFDVKIEGISGKSHATTLSSESLKQRLQQLAFVIYDGEGNELNRILQQSTDANFGKWEATVPSSSVITVAVIGSTAKFNINSAADPATTSLVIKNFDEARWMYLQPYPKLSDRIYTNAESFFKLDTIYVTGDSNVDIALERVVGKVEINVLDTDNYEVEVAKDAVEFDFSEKRGEGETDDTGASSFKYSGSPISLFLLRTHEPVVLRISGWSSDGRSTDRVLRVPVQRNKKTVISGNLFTDKMSTTVTINEDWEDDAPPIGL